MQKVIVYTKPLCGFCYRAMILLKQKGAEVTEISAAFNKKVRDEMLAKSNGKNTYPQIFIGETHIGGCDDLFALENTGKLDVVLNG